MIFSIADQYIAIRHDGDALKSFELWIARTPGSEGLQETAIRIEYLDAVVAWIGHEHVSLIVYCHATGIQHLSNQEDMIGLQSDFCNILLGIYVPWKFKLTIFRTFGTEGREYFSIDVENLFNRIYRF